MYYVNRILKKKTVEQSKLSESRFNLQFRFGCQRLLIEQLNEIAAQLSVYHKAQW